MQYAPPYIVQYLQDTTLDDMQKSQLILAAEPENEKDRDYLYTFSTSVLRHSAPPQLVIDKCNAYLPLVSTPECRRFLQSIRIWKHEKLEQYEKAIELRFEQAQEHDSFKHDYQDIAKAYKHIKDHENAIKNYEQYMALQDYAVDTEDYVELAELYEEVGDYKNSAKYHGMAAAWEARFSGDHWQMTGRALALDGQVDEAMFYFKVALKIDPKDAYSHYYMGRAYQEKKDKYRALHHYTQALKFKPDFAAVKLNIGSIEFHDEGDIKTAIKYFEEAIELDTKGEFLLTLYGNLRNLYGKIKEFEKSAYYRGKIFEQAGFPSDMGDYLDSLKNDLGGDDDDE
jgi:tetratricopeptide (TPR) repeat protein